MLRMLDLRAPWRSLAPGFWPSDVPLGKRSVIYGHNGSGKSTLCDLLLTLSQTGAPIEMVWEDAEGVDHAIDVMDLPPVPSIAVFSKRWVQQNLDAFLDGDTASAIVTLGREAISNKERIAELEVELEGHQEDARKADARAEEASRRAERIARDVQTDIASELGEVDRTRFTRQRYNITNVKADLVAFAKEVPDVAERSAALQRLGEPAPTRVQPPRPAPDSTAELLKEVAALLARTPTRLALASLEGSSDAQVWVERGRELHADRDQCLFCDGVVTEERREALARHFDESWLLLRSEATSLAQQLAFEVTALEEWPDTWPVPALVASDIRDAYAGGLSALEEVCRKRLAVLQEVQECLGAKGQDPSCVPVMPDVADSQLPFSATVPAQAVEQHNQRADNHERLREANIYMVLDHLLGSGRDKYTSAVKEDSEARALGRQAMKAAGLTEQVLEQTRAEQFTTSEMADRLTEDLSRVYGRNHLSVQVTSNGKSYACKRGNAPASHLSDGERTTLSLLYFLRQLKDESTRLDPAQRIVLIDDPSSSLDRESVFATHQWLTTALQDIGQWVVLTHDFNLLRLFLKSQKSQWDKSLKAIGQGDEDEERFPRVAFLEAFARNEAGDRRTHISRLPELLRRSTSEYAYLFLSIMNGLANPMDYDRLFLLPNAARRVLETFAAHHAPDQSHFDRQLEAMVQEPDLQPYRDVYDFCNRWSHGEGSEPVDVLDARAVYTSVRRCMEFLRAADPEHFRRMCKATGVDEGVLDG